MSMGVNGTLDLQPSASGNLGITGNPQNQKPGSTAIRVFSAQIIRGNSAIYTACPLYDGVNASGAEVILLEASGQLKGGTPLTFDEGVRFPSGCYWITDANCAGGHISYATEA